MKVRINLEKTSQPIDFQCEVTNTYEKGSFYCVFVQSNPGEVPKEGVVYKYPISRIFNVRESY